MSPPATVHTSPVFVHQVANSHLVLPAFLFALLIGIHSPPPMVAKPLSSIGLFEKYRVSSSPRPLVVACAS